MHVTHRTDEWKGECCNSIDWFLLNNKIVLVTGQHESGSSGLATQERCKGVTPWGSPPPIPGGDPLGVPTTHPLTQEDR